MRSAFRLRVLFVFPVHRPTDDERDGEEYRRADHHQPCVHGGASDRKLRGREKRYDEREEDRQKADAGHGPHPRLAARNAVAARQIGLRVAQFDACGVHHHVHHEVEADGEGAQQEEGDAHVVHEDVERRQQTDDAALNQQDVDLYAVLVDLLQEAGQLSLFRGPEQAAAGARNPRHHAGQCAERHQQAHDVGEPAHMVVVEDDLKGGEEPRLQVDLVIGGDDRHGQRSEREERERDESREEHGARELFLRIFQFGGVHGVHLDACEEQQNACEERDVAHAGDVREEPRMDVLQRIDVDDLTDFGRDAFEGDGVAAEDPDERHDDDYDAGQHRADQEALAGDSRDSRGAVQRNPCGEPVHDDRKQSDEQTVLRQIGHADQIGDGGGCEAEHRGIPDHVLDPLQEDGRETHMGVEGLLDPRVDAAAAFGEGAAELRTDEGCGNEEKEGGEKDVEEHGEFFLRHHGQSAKADDGGRRHQSEL